MTTTLGAILAAGLLLAFPLLALRYLTRLPDAPACPSCRTITRESDEIWLGAQVLGQLSGMSRRACTQCGWRGYMRWRWATHRTDQNGSG